MTIQSYQTQHLEGNLPTIVRPEAASALDAVSGSSLDVIALVPQRLGRPPLFRFLVRQSFGLLLGVLVVAFLVVVLNSAANGGLSQMGGELVELVLKKKGLIILVLAGAILLRMAYYVVYWLMLEFRIEADRLKTQKGVIFQEEGSVPLTELSEFYIKRGWRDILLGLADLHVQTPTKFESGATILPGLGYSKAKEIKRKLISIAESRDASPRSDLVRARRNRSVAHVPHLSIIDCTGTD